MKIFFASILLSLTLPSFANSVTASGISSGGYMAQQFHTAFSSTVSGVGVVAAGPYFCAKNNISTALTTCMKPGGNAPTSADSLDEAKKLERSGLIDPISNMAHSKVYILSGKMDQTVVTKVVDVLVDTYVKWGVSPKDLIYENKLAVGHAFPTMDYGNSCPTESTSPFISKCGRDVAGEILKHLIGPLSPKEKSMNSRLFSFDQLKSSVVNVETLSLAKTAYAYIPEGCERPAAAGCPIHVAFHGCKQTLEHIKDAYINRTGFNEWAQSNRIVIIYPQAVKNLMGNPNGCWDWWGYSGKDFHTKNGPQMKVVMDVVKNIQEGKLALKPATF